jgi:GNAT superfamily N-acetyltransferase
VSARADGAAVSSMDPVIRVATAADVTALLGLIRQYWELEHIEGFEAERLAPVLVELIAKPGFGCIWIVEDGNDAVGYLIAVYVYSIEHAGLTAEIDEFYLEPAHRSSGTGRRLLGVAEEEFVRAGCTNVSFQIGRTNAGARRFYERCGYAARDGYDLMDKMLSPAKR